MVPKVIPDVVSGQTIRSLRPQASALEAAHLMRDHHISAVVVLDEADALVGIVTERDLVRRVLAEERSPAAVSLAEVMTPRPLVVVPDASPYEALEIMRERHIRHLPVVDGGKVVGMVSMRDLRHAIAVAEKERRPPGLLHRLFR